MNQYAETVEKNNGYLYILRRTVPPWRWRENLDELVRLCPKYGIDEVCIKIDSRKFKAGVFLVNPSKFKITARICKVVTIGKEFCLFAFKRSVHLHDQ